MARREGAVSSGDFLWYRRELGTDASTFINLDRIERFGPLS